MVSLPTRDTTLETFRQKMSRLIQACSIKLHSLIYNQEFQHHTRRHEPMVHCNRTIKTPRYLMGIRSKWCLSILAMLLGSNRTRACQLPRGGTRRLPLVPLPLQRKGKKRNGVFVVTEKIASTKHRTRTSMSKSKPHAHLRSPQNSSTPPRDILLTVIGSSSSQHRQMHRQCPKEGCPWAGASDEKKKSRHVWTSHKIWAEDTNYPKMGLSCDLCGKVYRRKDYVARHKREEHQNIGRNRKDGG